MGIVSLCADMASELYYPLMPLYLSSIQVSVVGIGVIEGVAELIVGISKGYFGHWSDVLRRRVPFVKFGYLLSAISKPLIVLSNALAWIFVVRSADRLGKGIRSAARDALISDVSTKQNKAVHFGLHRSMDSIGAVLGPLIALLLLQCLNWSMQSILIFGIIPGLLAVICTLWLKDNPSTVVGKGKKPQFLAYFTYWSKASKEYKLAVVASSIFFVCNSSDMFLILQGNNILGSGKEVLSTMLYAYILYNMVYVCTSYPLGILSTKLGIRPILSVGLLLYAIVYIGMAYASNVVHIYVLFGLYGVYAGATDGLLKAYISNQISADEQGTGLGLFASIQSIMLMIASILAGVVWQQYGSYWMLIPSAIGAAVVGIYFGIQGNIKHKQ